MPWKNASRGRPVKTDHRNDIRRAAFNERHFEGEWRKGGSKGGVLRFKSSPHQTRPIYPHLAKNKLFPPNRQPVGEGHVGA